MRPEFNSQQVHGKAIKMISEKIAKLSSMRILDEKKESRVVLLGRNNKDLKIKPL